MTVPTEVKNAQLRAATQRYRDRHPARFILKRAKARAKRDGIEFNLAESDIEVPNMCPILNIEIVLPWDKMPFGGRSNSASLDRIDNSKGYVPGNVQVISNLANTMKSSATPEQLAAFARYYFREESHGN